MDVVVLLPVGVLAHMPIRDKASVYSVLAGLDSVVLDSPSNSCRAFGVQDCSSFGMAFFPIVENYFLCIFRNCFRRRALVFGVLIRTALLLLSGEELINHRHILSLLSATVNTYRHRNGTNRKKNFA